MSLSTDTFQAAKSIAELFIVLWEEIGVCLPTQRTIAVNPGSSFERELHEVLEGVSERVAIDSIIKQIDMNTRSKTVRWGKILAAMQVIDEFFIVFILGQ